ncbi:MAG: hypothetical protein ABI629_20430 [bacterium]
MTRRRAAALARRGVVRRGLVAGLLALTLCALPARAESAARFRTLAVWLDAGSEPLAAYQIEIRASDGATIVGVEGGATAAFAAPPHYDPAALQSGRIILATFTTAAHVPRGRTRVATLHVREAAGSAPTYRAEVVAAATPDGRRIPVTVELLAQQGDPA